jgi:sulfonate transport system substrate-binding protein
VTASFTQAAGAPLSLRPGDPSPSAEAIIVHDDSPIRAVADLKGRTVGVSKGCSRLRQAP